MAKYGIPYMGSKSTICDWLIQCFPPADHFYDVFGGGFSVTHAMLLGRSKDYKTFHFNEPRPGICKLIQSAISGHFSYQNFKPPFINRTEFFKKKDSDPYIKMCWSFGNNGRTYLFSKEIEPYKKSMHNAIVFNDFDDLAKEVLGINKFADGYDIKSKRLFLRNKIEYYRTQNTFPNPLIPYVKYVSKKTTISRQHKHPKQLQQLQQLQQLEQLQQLQQLEFTTLSYEQIHILPNSIIYCDPPYKGTASYDGDFDNQQFLNWANAQTNPVFISEYNINDPRFGIVAIKKSYQN